MKLLFALGLSIISATALACPNFSGEYVSEEFGTYYSITQDSCETIHYIYDEGIVDRALDAKEYMVTTYDVVVEEGVVLATVKIYESNEIQGEKLITKQRSETIYTKTGEVDHDSGWSEAFLNKKSDLVTVSHGAHGSGRTIDHRVSKEY
jgi:hypothetical protein